VAVLAIPIFAARAVGKRWAQVPSHVRFDFPSAVPWLTLNTATIALGVLAGATLVMAAIKLVWSAPWVPGKGLVLLLLSAAPWPLFEAGTVGAKVADCLNLCWGQTGATRFSLEGSGKTWHYGERRYDIYRSSHGAGYEYNWFVQWQGRTGELLEVQGKLGGFYLVVADDHRATCAWWHGNATP
jgi:hypothetical protein